MINTLIEYITAIYEATKTNPIAATMVGLYGASTLTYVLRGVPLNIYSFFKKHLTTSITVYSYDDRYHAIKDYLSLNQIQWLNRNIDITSYCVNSEEYKKSDKPTMVFGKTYCMFNKKILSVDRVEKTVNMQESKALAPEHIRITYFGRDRSLANKLLAKISELYFDEGKYNYVKHTEYGNQWTTYCKIHHRPLESLVFSNNTLKIIHDHISMFISKEHWFTDNHVPWRTGILLYGPPGTGKSSLVAALANHLKMDVYVIKPEDARNFDSVLKEVPEKCIILIEEIDCMCMSRDENEKPLDSINKNMLSSMINALDGITSRNGRIVIATTNHIEKLDAALIRDGRFNLKIELGYVDKGMMVSYLKRFYPELNDEALEFWEPKANLSPATMQKSIIEHMEGSYSDVLLDIAELKGVNDEKQTAVQS